MAKQSINIGSSANDGTGDPLRSAFDKINDNFTELYGTTAEANDLIEDATPQLGGDLDINGFNITSAVSNVNIRVIPNGTGTVELEGNTNVTGILTVSGTQTFTGATTLSTSLALASGATVTGIDNGALGTSATLLATQGAIKTYVDAQVTASDLDFTADDSTTNSIDLDSEVMQFSGGTGITTSAVNNTVTTAIDGTVVTLTGSQTLTNKILTNPTINAATMTGNITVDNLILNDSTISSSSNANINISPGGTGNVILGAVKVNGTTISSDDSTLITLAENVNVTGTLTTNDVTITGQVVVTGTLQTDSVLLKDNKITSANTNDNLEIDAAGTGIIDIQKAMTTIGQTITGSVGITGDLGVDNININANTIISTNTNGGINITPNGNGTITLGGNVVAVTNELAATDVAVGSELILGASASIQQSATNSDLILGTQGNGTVRINNPQTQTTVGSAGGATAVPAQPTGYLKLNLGGTVFAIPYYAAS